MTDNLVVLRGKITNGPHFCPYPTPGLVDFELKAGGGYHQVVSVEQDIVDQRKQLYGKIRVFGKLTSKDGDSVIMAQRIEFL